MISLLSNLRVRFPSKKNWQKQLSLIRAKLYPWEGDAPCANTDIGMAMDRIVSCMIRLRHDMDIHNLTPILQEVRF